ncbi:MAG: hypothetical protein KAQ94_06005 [Arcobacteraceae bacterium]|nr:hypothetical protein [Arcobacteraceae bacterium]
MGNFYNKGFKPDSELVKNLGKGGKGSAMAGLGRAVGDVAFKLGEQKQQTNDRKAKFDLAKNKKDKDAQTKTSIISGMKKLHPKTTKDLSDDEVFVLANKINDVHEDKTKRKMVDVFTAKNGDRVGVYDTGTDGTDGKRIYENVSFGKVRDWKKGGKFTDTGNELDPNSKNFNGIKWGKEQNKKRAIKRAAKFKLEDTEIQ